MRRAAAALLAAAAAVLLVPAAGHAAWPQTLPAAGFCVPAPEDPTAIPRAVHATGAPAGPTEPIAILATGVDPTAPQLTGRVLGGFDAGAGAPLSGDPDGFGTELAGVAAGSSTAMRGVTPSSSVLPVKIFDLGNRTTSADSIVKGIAYAVTNGARVIVLAGSGLAANASDADLLKVTNAIDAAFAKNVLVFAGAGDDSTNAAQVPASLPHVLVAGAATAANARTTTSSFGPWTDVLAPGDAITTPLPLSLCNQGYGFSSGTSFAAAAYAAAGAQIIAAQPGLTNQQYFELIRRSAGDTGASGRDDETGFGLLDVTVGTQGVPQSKETSAEPDDDISWTTGPNAAAHPLLLTKKKLRFKALGSVSPTKDPADVYRVSLSKRERLVVNVNATDPNALVELSILGPKAGPNDINNGVNRNRLVSTGGLSADPQLEYTASRSGTYYIAIEAPDAVDPDDPTATTPDLMPYQLSAYKQHKKAKKKRKKK